MKKVILIALLCLIAIPKVVAQEMPSVAGVTFGWTYEQCKEVLDRKFGENGSQDFPNTLGYSKILLGGNFFDLALFVFQSDGEKTYLCKIGLFKYFELNEEAEAFKYRDKLLETYSKKYICRWEIVDDDGYTNYVLGEDPIKPYDGFIIINTKKNKINERVTKLVTSVSYGPINFVKPEDEI